MRVCRMSALLLTLPVLAGCVTMMGLPPDSVRVGDYAGSFEGTFFWGSIELSVYETPDGAKPVIGHLQQLATQSLLNFHGQMNGARLQATYTLVYGEITGELSPDGRTFSGTYRITDPPFDRGTWTATRR